MNKKWNVDYLPKDEQANPVNHYDIYRDDEQTDKVAEAWRGEDAKLIAAAPELLAALEALLESGEKTNRAFYVDGKKSALLIAFEGQTVLLQNARDAIRKAKGE